MLRIKERRYRQLQNALVNFAVHGGDFEKVLEGFRKLEPEAISERLPDSPYMFVIRFLSNDYCKKAECKKFAEYSVGGSLFNPHWVCEGHCEELLSAAMTLGIRVIDGDFRDGQKRVAQPATEEEPAAREEPRNGS